MNTHLSAMWLERTTLAQLSNHFGLYALPYPYMENIVALVMFGK